MISADTKLGVIKAVYDQFKGKKTMTKDGKPYSTVVITNMAGMEEKYTVFQGDVFNQMFEREKLTVGDNVCYITILSKPTAAGIQYTNLASCWRNPNASAYKPVNASPVSSSPVQDKNSYFIQRDAEIGKMAEEKLMLGYRELAFDMLKASLAYCKDVKFQSEDDFIRQHLFDIEKLAIKLRNPAEEADIKEETIIEEVLQCAENA